jgi:acyl-CoA thioesterase-2
MHPRLANLIEILALESLETNLFRGIHPEGTRGRLYGGQIMAQALIAAGRTVKERGPHSLHGYFLRPGDATIPVVFKVEPIRDGASFSTRRVVAVQRGQAIFSMDASFQVVEDGLDHQSAMPESQPPARIPDVLLNDAFVAFRENYAEMKRMLPMQPRKRVWFRTNGELDDDDPLLHAALLTYQSDDDLLSTARLPHRGGYDRSRMQGASLDHAMWFHRKTRVDRWLLYDLDSPSAAQARGYNRGTIFTVDGQLVASTMQEGLMRFR